jgi:hypothetical protein
MPSINGNIRMIVQPFSSWNRQALRVPDRHEGFATNYGGVGQHSSICYSIVSPLCSLANPRSNYGKMMPEQSSVMKSFQNVEVT